MEKILTNYQNPLQRADRDSTCKLLVFSMGRLYLALPVTAVKKIREFKAMYGSGLGASGVVLVDDVELTTIDLHKKLFKVERPSVPGGKDYLIVAVDSAGEPFCIKVGETPLLYDLPLSEIRVLPESYRRSDTLSIASHVTVITEKDTSKTVFLLDVDRLLA